MILGLCARLHEAIKNGYGTFSIWDSSKPRREFLYVEYMARACIHVIKQSKNAPDFVNIGTGEDIEIGELATIIADKIGFTGKLVNDEKTFRCFKNQRNWLDSKCKS